MKSWLIYDNINKYYYESTFANVCEKPHPVSYEIFYKENYGCEFSDTKNIYEMFSCIVKPNDVVVDLGANVGFFTDKIASTASKVISVEGAPELFSCLVKNTYQHQNIEYLNANIISDRNVKEKNIWSYRPSRLNINLKQLFEIYELDRIDFLKVDIESAEYDIFYEGFSSDLLSKIKNISMEVHLDQFNPDLEKLEKLLRCFKNKKIEQFDWRMPSHLQKTIYISEL